MVLGLLWCSTAFAEDLTGTQVLCKHKAWNEKTIPNIPNKWMYRGLKFLSEKSVERYDFYKFEISISKRGYSVKPHAIVTGLWRLNRETLELRAYYCEILDKGTNVYTELKKISERAVKKQKEKNKI